MRVRPWMLTLATLACASRLAAQAPDSTRAWSFGASAYLYLAADPTFLLPIVTADHDALHLEARYNYEDLRTFSGWVGWTFETGDQLHLAATPMVGGVVGRADGVAPGLELTLGWRRLELYSESEYLIPIGSDDDPYLYTWTQATWRPLDWLTVGLSGQRLRSTGSELTLDRGPMAGVAVGPVELDAFFYNPFSSDAFTVLAASLGF